MKKSLILFSFMSLAIAPLTHADDAVIKHSPLTESGVLYVFDDGRYIIRGSLYNVGSDHPVNVTNQPLSNRLNALQKR
ncbi:MAG: Thiol:disulfide interchange protein DsbC [Sodalis sp.]|nr:MAG: Thiol:disulfide interchange protein DsbC [Sodalis sp.]